MGAILFYCNSNIKAGGSAVYVSDDMNCQQLDIVKINVDGCEEVWVKLNFNRNESLIVNTVYKHPSLKIKSFEDTFVNVIKSINLNYIALGDYNITTTKGYHRKKFLIILIICAELDVYNSLINQQEQEKHPVLTYI